MKRRSFMGDGVAYYTNALLPVAFPEERVNCSFCPALRRDSASDQHYCQRTGEILLVYKQYIGQKCPLEFEEDNK